MSGSLPIGRLGGNGPLVTYCGGSPNMIGRYGDVFDGRDPDGWRIQFVDAKRDEPTE
jgi:hypothetical protein